MQKLLIIDGNAIMHRAYHAYPPLTNPKGEYISIVYGFFTMLFLVLQEQKPEYLVVCFDMAKPTFRQSLFAGYHAHRQELPDDFVPQIGLLHELLEIMGVQICELNGYEADDLIGTIAYETTKDKKLKTENLNVVILTGDRDMLQLVDPNVKVLMPLVGITKTVLFDEAAVEEKYGVKSSQFVDYKALIGDVSDGYPGVAGIGPKTAAKLIQEYGTFENLYENIEKLPEKTGLKLATDAEQAALAKKLAAILTDVPIQFDIKKCACTDFDIKALRTAFKEHEFKSLLARLDGMFGKEEDQLSLL